MYLNKVSFVPLLSWSFACHTTSTTDAKGGISSLQNDSTEQSQNSQTKLKGGMSERERDGRLIWDKLTGWVAHWLCWWLVSITWSNYPQPLLLKIIKDFLAQATPINSPQLYLFFTEKKSLCVCFGTLQHDMIYYASFKIRFWNPL